MKRKTAVFVALDGNNETGKSRFSTQLDTGIWMWIGTILATAIAIISVVIHQKMRKGNVEEKIGGGEEGKMYDKNKAGAVFTVIMVVAVFFMAAISTVASETSNQGTTDTNLLKLEESLREKVRSGDVNETVSVIVVLVEQPVHDISDEVKAEYKPQLENITDPEELDKKGSQMRKEILARAEPLLEETQAPIIEKMEAHGCEIGYCGKIYNCIVADVPVSYLEELCKEPSIAEIWPNQVLTGAGTGPGIIEDLKPLKTPEHTSKYKETDGSGKTDESKFSTHSGIGIWIGIIVAIAIAIIYSCNVPN